MVEQSLQHADGRAAAAAVVPAPVGIRKQHRVHRRSGGNDLRIAVRAFAAKASLILEWVVQEARGSRSSTRISSAKLRRTRRRCGVRPSRPSSGWFGKEEAVEELRERILEEKTLDWMLERSQPGRILRSAAGRIAGRGRGFLRNFRAGEPGGGFPRPLSDAPADGAHAILDGKIDALKDALASRSLDERARIELLAAEVDGQPQPQGGGRVRSRQDARISESAEVTREPADPPNRDLDA